MLPFSPPVVHRLSQSPGISFSFFVSAEVVERNVFDIFSMKCYQIHENDTDDVEHDDVDVEDDDEE